MRKKLTFALAAILLSVGGQAALGQTTNLYAVTNHASGNSVAVFARGPDGRFSLKTEVSTGGLGTGDLEIPALKKDETHPLANGDDPLISANAIAGTDDGRYLIVVNPGDSTVSLMEIDEAGLPRQTAKAATSDTFPVSVATWGDHVAVASVGANNNNGSISLFLIQDGALKPVKGSRRDLQARPSTIAFSSNGRHVIVNELVTGKIKIFRVTDTTLSDQPVSSVDSPRDRADRFHAIPVGFSVYQQGNADVIAMSEARFLTPDFGLRQGQGEVPQSPLYSWQTGSVSTYELTETGDISLISGDVLTGSAVEGGEIANCWVVMSPDGQTLWAANALSSSISAFRIRKNGTIALINDRAFRDEGQTSFFSDIAISAAGDEIYQLVGNKGEVWIFDVSQTGDLSLKQVVSGLPALGAFGLLVR